MSALSRELHCTSGNISDESGLVLVPPQLQIALELSEAFQTQAVPQLGVPRTLANPAAVQGLGNEEQAIRECLCGSADFLSVAGDFSKSKRRILRAAFSCG